MAKRTSNSSVNSSIRQQTKAQDEGFGKLLEAQQAALGELSAIKDLLQLSRDYQQLISVENAGEFIEQKRMLDTLHSMAKTTEQLVKVQELQEKAQEELLENSKQQLKGSRRYWKLQEDFEKEWRKEAKDIAEMAKGMKTFKSLGDKWGEKKEGIKEKFGIANGGLKKTVLGALNVGGIFNKTLERDKFVAQQKALGSTASTKQLREDYEGAHAAAKETKKTEAAIAKHKQIAGIDDEEHLRKVSPEFAKLLEKRQENADEYGKYQRAVDIKSPTPVTRLDSAQGMNVFGKPAEPAATPTQTAAEATQGAEAAEESARVQEKEVHLLETIAANTGGTHNEVKPKPEEKKPEGGGFLDTIFSMLSSGLMSAFKALLNPGAILKALGKVFAIGMIVGALFEGIMDGFDEFMKTGDIGKALIAGLAGIIDFLTFGLFDKEKIKEVIGDFASWTYDHLVKPFTDFITGIKDSFLSVLENIGIPKFTIFKNPITDKEYTVGPFYPFKSDAKTEAATPEAVAPTTANQVEQQSADNAGAKETPAASNKTNVVNAPVTTNNNTTQVQLRPPIRNQDSSQTRYLQSKYA